MYFTGDCKAHDAGRSLDYDANERNALGACLGITLRDDTLRDLIRGSLHQTSEQRRMSIW